VATTLKVKCFVERSCAAGEDPWPFLVYTKDVAFI
jgi:hypothetical protein